MPDLEYFIEQTNRLESWMKSKAIPLWSSIGINPENQSAFECLDPSGVPDYSANLRARVQSRQIFVFCSAYLMGWMHNAKEKVLGINQFLNANAKNTQQSAGYAHLLTTSGKILDSKNDTYDFAFFILASAYRYKVFNDKKAIQEAEEIAAYIDVSFKAQYGGWSEGNYTCDVRRQNPHMHLFEAFLTCYEFTLDAKWLARAGQIFTLFESAFYDPKNYVVREFFNHDWSLNEGRLGTIVEPGHMFEWIWLLRWYQKFTQAPVDDYCNNLYAKAVKIGFAKNTKLVFDEVTLDGTVIKSSKRLWPITEFIKASVAQAEFTPSNKAYYQGQAADGIDSLFQHYFHQPRTIAAGDISDDQPNLLEAFSGRYIDQLDVNNQACASHAPSSSLYHIATAAVMASNYVNRVTNEA